MNERQNVPPKANGTDGSLLARGNIMRSCAEVKEKVKEL
jgi:hypothetical protein